MWFPLLFGVLLLSLTDALTEQRQKGCLPQHEFTLQARKLLRRAGRHTQHRAAAVRAAPAPSCSDFTHIFSHDLNNRSLSPWRSRLETDHSLIPAVYEVAECLCSGCIINGSESTDYNSVPVLQSVMFLQKVSCPSDPENYSYNVVYRTLPVACTCVVPSNTLL